jgi:hypothetical protein
MAMPNRQPRLSKDLARCPICEEPIAWRQARLFKTCDSWKCRRSHRERERVRRRQKDEQFEQWHKHRLECAELVREADAASSNLKERQSYAIIVLAANRRQLAPLPGKRRGQFVRRLARLVDDTLAIPPDYPTTNSPTDEEEETLMPILETACAICSGHCCLKGGIHAFLHESTIHHYRHNHPEAAARDIVEAYCHFIPRHAFKGSCVFQSATGCTLPRPMRSETCNRVICSGLIELRESIQCSGRNRFYLAAMRRDQVIRSKFVEFCEHSGQPAYQVKTPIDGK